MLKRFVKRFSYLAFSIICIFSLSIPCLAVATSSARMANIDTARCSLEVSDQSVAANARVKGIEGLFYYKTNAGQVFGIPFGAGISLNV